jgi:flavin-dependent dehydrogenase
VRHTVRNIRAEPDGFVVDDEFRCRYLIGAGGTRCPVYRTLFRELNPRVSELQTVTLEHEIEYDWKDPACHLWFFDKGLPGYSWYVPKENGWLNVGIGGMADRMKASGGGLKLFGATMRSLRAMRPGWPRATWPRESGLPFAVVCGLRIRFSTVFPIGWTT